LKSGSPLFNGQNRGRWLPNGQNGRWTGRGSVN
jgi:hypothetical protein